MSCRRWHSGRTSVLHLLEHPIRPHDDRPAAGAAPAAADGAAIVAAGLELLEEGLDTLAVVDSSTLPERCLTDAIRRLGRLGGRVEGIQARLVSAAEAAGVPERSGASSTTSWLSQETNRSGGQSARTARLAKAGEAVPELVDEVASGTVGPDQAGAVASALDRDELDPEDAIDLLPAARRLPPSMMGRETRRVSGERRQRRLRAQELRARDERHLRTWRLDDGSLRYEGQMPADEGDRFEKARGAFYQPDGKDTPDDQRRTHAQRNADALAAMTDAALRSGDAGEVGGALPQISVTITPEMLAAGREAEAAGAVGITDLDTVLSAAATHKLLCDAVVRRVVIGPGGQPLDVGRATRNWSPAQRAAVAARDGGCRGPACDLPMGRCILHHVNWWRDGGTTDIANAAPLCHRHHDLVHDEGWALEMDPATRIVTWTAPDGTVHVDHPRGPTLDLLRGPGRPRSHGAGRPSGRDDPPRPRAAGPDASPARLDRGPPARAERGPPRDDPGSSAPAEPASLQLEL